MAWGVAARRYAGLMLAIGTFAASQAGLASAQPVCVRPDQPASVRSGEDTVDYWPGFAALRLVGSGDEQFFCGATAIAKDWLVTAAHCVQNLTKSQDGVVGESGGRLEAVLGTTDLDVIPKWNIFPAVDLVLHEQYQEFRERGSLAGIAHDIGLIRIGQPWNGALAPVASIKDERSSRMLRVAGFGLAIGQADRKSFKRSSDGSVYLAGSRMMKIATVPHVSLERCRKAYPQSTRITPDQICAGTIWHGEDSCAGDSGGPMMTPDGVSGCPVFVGIVSWGPSVCGEPTKYGVYTRIADYVEWIKAKSGVEIAVAEANELPLDAMRKDLLAQIDAAMAPVARSVDILLPAGAKLKLGRYFKITVDSKVDGKLLLFEVKPDGRIRQIVPNAFSTGDVELVADTPLKLPNKALHGFDIFEADPPAGRGQLIALVVPAAFPYKTFRDGAQWLGEGKRAAPLFQYSDRTGTAYLTHLVDQVQRAVAASGAGTPGAKTWGYGKLDYEYLE